jgi:proprotein convertase subtilisin/kexin type 5
MCTGPSPLDCTNCKSNAHKVKTSTCTGDACAFMCKCDINFQFDPANGNCVAIDLNPCNVSRKWMTDNNDPAACVNCTQELCTECENGDKGSCRACGPRSVMIWRTVDVKDNIGMGECQCVENSFKTGAGATAACDACDATCYGCTATGTTNCTQCAKYRTKLPNNTCGCKPKFIGGGCTYDPAFPCPIDMYQDTTTKKCMRCNPYCETCDGPQGAQCTSCDQAMNMVFIPSTLKTADNTTVNTGSC